MDKYILCLANSYKHGGRCIAGIEVTINNGTYTIVRDANGVPKWLRPISHSAAGEVPNYHALNIKILSIVKITGIEYAGMYSHSEDVYYQSLSVYYKVKLTKNVLNDCLDNFHSTIFGNKGKALTPICFQNGNYSVMLVFAVKSEVYMDTRFDVPKARMKFVHNNNYYDFPITDPIYLERIKHDNNCIGILSDVYLVLSLGIEHEGWHSKLIASIIETKEEITQSIIAQSLGKEGQRITPNDNKVNIDQKVISQSKFCVNKSPNIATHTTIFDSKEKVNTIKNNLETNIKQEDHTIDYSSMSLKEIKDQLRKTTLSTSEKKALYNSFLERQSETITHLNQLSNFDNSEQKQLPPESSIPRKHSKPEGCYIATSVYGSYDAPEVIVLRQYRDTILKKTFCGRIFISIYYMISPYIVNKMKGHKRINMTIKKILDKLVLYLRQ